MDAVEVPKQGKKSLRWDEENLDYNEEHKTPKMKIDEPPTPFNFDYCDDEVDEGMMPLRVKPADIEAPDLGARAPKVRASMC